MPSFGKAGALKEELTSKLLFVAIFSCMGAFTFGFDNGWWGGVLGNSYFNHVFGTIATVAADGSPTFKLSDVQTSTGTSLGTAGIAIGCMAAGYLAQLMGRRNTFYVTALGSIAGVVIQLTAGVNGGRYWQLVAGKIVICLSIGVASVSVPLYLAECAPAPIRGAMVNSYVWIQAVGSFMANLVLYLILNRQDMSVWCIPIGLQLVAPIFSLCFAHMLPESPRWFVEKGRVDDARASLLALRKGKAGYSPDEDLADMEAAFAEKMSKANTTWIQCFKGKNGIRTFIVAGVQALQQGQGLNFIASYLVLFLMQLGIPDPYKILVIVFSFLIPFTATGFMIQDYFGRRFLLIAGSLGMGGSMLALAAVTTKYPAPVGGMANACVAFIALWLFFFTQSWTNIPWTVAAELPADEMRDKTLAIGAFAGYVTGLVIGQVSPFIQTALGGKIGYIWAGMSGVTAVWCYFFIPELKGKTLEEVDYLFDHNVPLRKMGSYDVPHQTSLPVHTADSIEGKEKELDVEHVL